MNWEAYMESLERNKCGEFIDNKAIEIESMIEGYMEFIFDEYNYILPCDIELIAYRKINRMAYLKTIELKEKMG